MKTLKHHLKHSLTMVVILLSAIGWAQNCSEYFPITPGTTYEITHYDKKNSIESVTHNEVLSTSGNKAEIHTVVKDNADSETLNATYEMLCENDGVTIDFNSLIGKQLASELKDKDVDVKIDGTNFYLPNKLEKGQTLPDTNMNMDIDAGSMAMNFKVSTINRKVTGKETITVPAGTFDCIIIESETTLKMLITKHTVSKKWLAKGVGVVKTENYKKNGKLDSSEVLTAFNK